MMWLFALSLGVCIFVMAFGALRTMRPVDLWGEPSLTLTQITITSLDGKTVIHLPSARIHVFGQSRNFRFVPEAWHVG